MSNGECVEIAAVRGTVAIRDSKNPDGVKITCPPDAFRKFLGTIQRGEAQSRPFRPI